jgi:uncharacterized protein (TIGR03437 family)
MHRSALSLWLMVSGLEAAALRHLADPLPLLFEENRGQAPAEVRFFMRGAPMYLTATSFGILPDRILFHFRGAVNPAPSLVAVTPGPLRINVLKGADPQRWRRDVPTALSVAYRDLYSGIEPAFVSSPAGVTLQLRIAPNASLQGFAMEVAGARSVNVAATADGGLSLLGSIVTFKIAPPEGWQTIGGQRITISARFVVEGNKVSLMTGEHDRAAPLTIECKLPVLSPLVTSVTSMATDSAGNIYLTSSVSAVPVEPFPANVCARGDVGNVTLCGDGLVLKLDATGQPLWLTYLQGSNHDWTNHLQVDGAGDPYVAGSTYSSDFPVTAGSFQSAHAGPSDIVQRRNLFPGGDLFVTKLDRQSGMPVYSTFAGSSQSETPHDFALGSDGVAYLLTGGSPGLPATFGAWRSAPESIFESFVLGIAADGTRLTLGTYLPGSHSAMALAPDATVVVAGSGMPGLPSTPNAIQKEHGGQSDAYLIQLDREGSRPLLATYWGGAGSEQVETLAVDPQSIAWISGATNSPKTFLPNGSDPGQGDGFLLRLDLTNSRLMTAYRTSAGKLIKHPSGGYLGFAFVRTANLPVSNDAISGAGCGYYINRYLALFDREGAHRWSSYLSADSQSAAVLPNGDLVLFTRQGIDRLALDAPAEFKLACVTNAADRGNTEAVSPGEIVTLAGSLIGPEEPETASPASDRYPFVLGGARVFFDGIPAPLLYAGRGQINAIVPWAVRTGGAVQVDVERQGRIASLPGINVNPSDFALFTRDSSGTGQAAALNEDGTLNSDGNPARWGSIVVLYGTGAGPLIPPGVDGELAPLSTESRPVMPVEVRLVGLPCHVLYAGAAPGLVSGANQINCRLPERPAEGFEGTVNLPVFGRIGDRFPNGQTATIAIR